MPTVFRYSQPNNAFARDTVGDIYAKFHKQGLSEEAVGANEAMGAIYGKLVEFNSKQRWDDVFVFFWNINEKLLQRWKIIFSLNEIF